MVCLPGGETSLGHPARIPVIGRFAGGWLFREKTCNVRGTVFAWVTVNRGLMQSIQNDQLHLSALLNTCNSVLAKGPLGRDFSLFRFRSFKDV